MKKKRRNLYCRLVERKNQRMISDYLEIGKRCLIFKKCFRHCWINLDGFIAKIPNSLIVIESGKCYISESHDFPTIGKCKLNILEIKEYEINILKTVVVNIIIVQRIQYNDWLLIDKKGNQYYNTYIIPYEESYIPIPYIGRSHEGKIPKVGQSFCFDSFISLYYEFFDNFYKYERQFETVEIDEVESVVRLGEISGLKEDLFLVSRYVSEYECICDQIDYPKFSYVQVPRKTKK